MLCSSPVTSRLDGGARERRWRWFLERIFIEVGERSGRYEQAACHTTTDLWTELGTCAVGGEEEGAKLCQLMVGWWAVMVEGSTP